MRRAAPLALCVLLSACPEPAPRTHATLDLTVPSSAPSPRLPLGAQSLRTQADFDALEDRFLGRVDPAPLLAALGRLAAAAQPATTPEHALLLMRLAVLYRDQDEAARATSGTDYLHEALALGTRLRAEAPNSPHTLFLQGYIPFAFLGGSAESAMIVTAERRELAAACRDQWRALLVVAPEYDGPRAFDHERLREVTASLDLALAESAKPTATAVEPRSAVAESRAGLDALNQLARFEGAPEGDRKTLCRDWDTARAAAGAQDARSRAELRLDLACATLLGKIDIAVALIVRIRDLDGAAFSPCIALERLRDRADSDRIAAAVRDTDLDCR